MALRKSLLGLAGLVMLASSVTMLVAQEARPPASAIKVSPLSSKQEQRAVALLAGHDVFERLSDQALRQRLGLFRSILAGGQLSADTERALVARLDTARQVLRARILARDNNKTTQVPRAGKGQRPPVMSGQNMAGQDIAAILADRRPPTVLPVDQLNRRIPVYREACLDQRYSAEDRAAFTHYLQEDRAELGRRLLNDRSQREARLRQDKSLLKRVELNLAPRTRSSPPILWADEVDSGAIERQFATGLLLRLPRRYSRSDLFAQLETVMAQPAIRKAISGVEFDTIGFSSNDASLHEEDIASLDRIGRVIERILAAHPNEIFVIEGYTDAVGDEAANLDLSRKRAEAVKQALARYYVISSDNLVAVGLGEQYLNIPTEAPEQENRRLTIRRITMLIGS